MKIILIAALLSMAACSGAPKSNPESGPLHEAPNDAPAPTPKGPPVLANSVGQKQRVVPPVRAGDESSPRVSKAEVSSFMEQGPAFLLTQVDVKPVHGKEGFEGFKLIATRGGVRSFMEPQIRMGDVVTHINGIRLERPNDYLQAWNSLAKTEWIRVDFTRDKERKHALWAVEN